MIVLRNLNNELRKIDLSTFRPFQIDCIGFAIDNVIFFFQKCQFSHIAPALPPPKKKKNYSIIRGELKDPRSSTYAN